MALLRADEDYVFQSGYLHAPQAQLAPSQREDMWSAAMTVEEAKELCNSEETGTGRQRDNSGHDGLGGRGKGSQSRLVRQSD